MCTLLNLASTISSNPAHLSTALVARLLDHVTVLVSDEHSSVRPHPPNNIACNQRKRLIPLLVRTEVQICVA
jgi:hypothetical protein